MIMLSKSEKLVVIGIVVLFISIVLVAFADRDQDAVYEAGSPNQQAHNEYPSYENIATPPYGYNNPQPSPSSDRAEIFKNKVKGYRESTYWGSEHPLDVRIEEMNDDEFNRYVSEEVVQNDNDVYWGIEY
jgi:hypothetical protein